MPLGGVLHGASRGHADAETLVLHTDPVPAALVAQCDVAIRIALRKPDLPPQSSGRHLGKAQGRRGYQTWMHGLGSAPAA